MSLRRTSRRDDNEQGIIDALVSIGAQVKPMQQPRVNAVHVRNLTTGDGRVLYVNWP